MLKVLSLCVLLIEFAQHRLRYLIRQNCVGFRPPVELVTSGEFELRH